MTRNVVRRNFAPRSAARWAATWSSRWVGDKLKGETLYGNQAMELGQIVRSAAVIGADPHLPPAADPDAWAGQPGVRAPHLWVRRRSETISTTDVFTRNFTLISEDGRWIEAARKASQLLGIPVDTVQVPEDVTFAEDARFGAAFGVTSHGASLVRPDGIVAWRSPQMQNDPAACLRDIVQQIAALST